MFVKVVVLIKLYVTEDDRNIVAFSLQQREKLFPIPRLLELFCIFAGPSVHKTHFESNRFLLRCSSEKKVNS